MILTARTLFTVVAALGSVFWVPEISQGAPRGGAVFVMTNAASKNEVISFERTADGQLYDGGRFETGGRGSGGQTDPLESQGSLTLSQDRSLLFAANAGSGNVSVFRVHHASLSLVEKTPSGGSQPVAVAQWRDLVYVLNSGGSGSVVGFRLDNAGHLQQIKHSTAFLTANVTGGASISVSPNGQFLVVTERLANNIDSFRINADGTLAAIMVNQSKSPGTFSATFSPGGFVIVSETGAAGAMNGSAMSSYSVLSNGMLAAITQSIPTLGAANCWNAITPDGRFAYGSNAGSATVSGFSISSDGKLTPVRGTVAGVNPAGSTNLDIAISADGRFLYTLNSGTGNIGIFAIQSDGTLTSMGDAGDLPKMAGFNGIAAL